MDIEVLLWFCIYLNVFRCYLARFSTLFDVIYPDFPLYLTGFFPGRHLIQFLANKMQICSTYLHSYF